MVRLVAALIVVLAVVIFAVENTQSVRLTFVGLRFPALRLPVLVFGSVLLGAVAVTLIGSFELLRMRRRIVVLERQAAVSSLVAAPGPESLPAGEPSAAMPGLPPPADAAEESGAAVDARPARAESEATPHG